ncbi:asparagine synthase-related protein [Streptosporangium jomthongense]|uniref:asparagine synthase (glutamine-hydrolyzing) n=1 Tax=Streptosporangium jomthongense TaxID=1193683 RepID=A0ABV8F1T8_9ACTN
MNEIVEHAGEILFRHPSGFPWIIGGDGRGIVRAGNRDIDVILLGNSGAAFTESDLARLVGDRKTVRELDSVAERLVEGDLLLFARENTRMRSQGPLLLTRALCWAMVDGVPLISDDQHTLRTLARLRPDPAVLASRLTDAEITHAYGLRSVWEGVHVTGPGEWLDSWNDRAPARTVWWRPPHPGRSVDDLAEELRGAVTEALRLRTAGHQEISADLSGGLDSTTLCFFLADLGLKPHTLFLASANVANNDHRWAGRAAAELGVDHHSVPYGSVIPHLLDERTGTVATAPEGPGIANAALASVSMIEEVMKETGTTLHLNGHAGDALFGSVSTMLWSLFHSREKGRYRRTWRFRVLNRHPLGQTIRMLAERGSYLDDLRRIARHDFGVRDEGVAAYSRWVPLPKVHPALTETAREHLRRLAADAVLGERGAFSEDRTVNQILDYLVVHGNVVRRMNQAATPGGIIFDSPYLDRRVVEAALALGVGARSHQYPAKPLLAAARPPAMALDYFTRPDKGDYTAEVFAQHQAVKPVLRRLFADGSALEDLGLVSAERVLRLAERYTTSGTAYTDLDNIVIAERWLRSVGQGE